MKKITFIIAISLVCFAAVAQKYTLARVDGHYKTIQQLDGTPNRSRAWMDTIPYPPAEYGSSIVYLLVKPYYLSEAQVKTLSGSVRFPANSSDQVRKELDYLLELQARRTPDQVTRAEFLGNIGYWPSINMVETHPLYDQNLTDLFFLGREVLGKEIDAKNSPEISRLLQGMMQDMRVIEFTIKYKLLRPRPYHLEPRLNPLSKINSPSFASGHTLWAFLQAFTWGELVPERQHEFLELAEEIRRSREIMGIHYPSDNEASRQLAYKMMTYYFKNDVFLKDYSKAEAEWKNLSKKNK